jgi:hypothetical protein
VDPLNGEPFIKVAEVDEAGVQVLYLKYIHFVVPRKTCLVKTQTRYIRFEDVFFFYFLTFQTMKCLSD